MKESMIKVVFLGFLAVILMMLTTATMVGAEQPPKELCIRGRVSPLDGRAAPDEPLEWYDLTYNAIDPCRIIDTRDYGSPFLPDEYGIDVTYNCPTIPKDAKAIMINVAATECTGMGNLRGFAYSYAVPNTAMLNYGKIAGLNAISNAAAIPLCGELSCDYQLGIYISRATHFVIDAMGYFK